MENRNSKEELKELLDSEYVLKDECEKQQEECAKRQAEINKKLHNDDKRIELLIQKWNILEKLMWIITTSAVGILVTNIFNTIWG